LTALQSDESPVAHGQRWQLAHMYSREALAEHLMPVEWITALRTHELPIRYDRWRCRPGHHWLRAATVSVELVEAAHTDVFDAHRHCLKGFPNSPPVKPTAHMGDCGGCASRL
jgi:hypothetical protein